MDVIAIIGIDSDEFQKVLQGIFEGFFISTRIHFEGPIQTIDAGLHNLWMRPLESRQPIDVFFVREKLHILNVLL